jgi:hypothetical protein
MDTYIGVWKVKKIFGLFIAFGLVFIICSDVYAQGSAGRGASLQPRYIIDMPTAGLLPRGSYSIEADFFQEGGVMMRLNTGIMSRVNFGISYGANHVVGSEKIRTNPLPGVNIRLRVLDETTVTPALLIGFDSQGKEPYIRNLERYTIKSPGFFIAVSKNYLILGYLSVHGGFNYSLEDEDGSKGPNVYTGIEKSLGSNISLLLEYNLGMNDHRDRAVGRGRGYLNTGMRWSFGKGFTVGFDLKDLFKNQERVSVGNRTVNIEFVNYF